jgi:hypothetical protein
MKNGCLAGSCRETAVRFIHSQAKKAILIVRVSRKDIVRRRKPRFAKLAMKFAYPFQSLSYSDWSEPSRTTESRLRGQAFSEFLLLCESIENNEASFKMQFHSKKWCCWRIGPAKWSSNCFKSSSFSSKMLILESRGAPKESGANDDSASSLPSCLEKEATQRTLSLKWVFVFIRLLQKVPLSIG